MAVVTVLTMSSTVVVGFFHADPRHWVASGFFKDGTTGVSNVMRIMPHLSRRFLVPSHDERIK